jgi:hypothetical protein
VYRVQVRLGERAEARDCRDRVCAASADGGLSSSAQLLRVVAALEVSKYFGDQYVRALLDAHESVGELARGKSRFLKWAVAHVNVTIAHFAAPDGSFYDRAVSTEQLGNLQQPLRVPFAVILPQGYVPSADASRKHLIDPRTVNTSGSYWLAARVGKIAFDS